MKAGDRVIHTDYPNIQGIIVAKTQKWGGAASICHVKWANDSRTSQHIEHALKKIGEIKMTIGNVSP